MGFIYQITNTINGNFYIGQTKGKPTARFRSHRWNSTKEQYRNNRFYNALKKYGADNFILSVLVEVDNEKLDKVEINYIQLLKPVYNTSPGGKSTMGFSGKKLNKEHYNNLRSSNLKEVYRYDLDGNFLDKHRSLIDAALSLGSRLGAKQISHCIRGQQSTALGFVWRTKLTTVDKYIPGSRAFKIEQWSVEGNLVRIWDSARQAELVGGFTNSKISLCCAGKRKKHAGFIWKKHE